MNELSFNHVSPECLPEAVVLEFWSRSKLYTDQAGLMPPEFDSLVAGTHPNGDVSYLGTHSKKYTSLEVPEILTYLIDVDSKQELTGVGEIRHMSNSPNTYLHDKPFVGWTGTSREFRNQGLARRRILTMQAASLFLHGNSLYSSTLFAHPNALRVWRRLEDEGLVLNFVETQGEPKDEGLKRFKFN